jgi:hypothetical protein
VNEWAVYLVALRIEERPPQPLESVAVDEIPWE